MSRKEPKPPDWAAALDLRDGVVGGADDREARGVQGVDERLEVSVLGASGSAATRWK